MEKNEKRQLECNSRLSEDKYHVHVITIFILLIRKFQDMFELIQNSLRIVEKLKKVEGQGAYTLAYIYSLSHCTKGFCFSCNLIISNE